ncbi:hypothetical protein [Arthrobacter sp. NyZ413]|uniref:hypothetical protein n=1 Tax=Arthrobacter sp. NyZ413 TaxID=3144669 RepID=UPI003BF80F47
MSTHISVAELDPEVHEEQNAVPDGYQLNFDSTDPIWEGPATEGAWARWYYDRGIVVEVLMNNGNTMIAVPIDKARELHRNLTGILEVMGELEPAYAA